MTVSPSLFLAVCGVGTSTSVLDGRLISPPSPRKNAKHWEINISLTNTDAVVFYSQITIKGYPSVVICWKNSIFVISKTSRPFRASPRRWLWFAEKIVPLLYQRHPLSNSTLSKKNKTSPEPRDPIQTVLVHSPEDIGKITSNISNYQIK